MSTVTDFPTPDMAFAERLAQLRKERGLTLQALGEVAGVHWTQIQRYETGGAQPTLDVLKRLAIALSASTDWLLFEAEERGPDDALKLQFEAVRQFDEDERRTALDVLEGLILKHQAKRMMQRSQSPTAAPRTAKSSSRTRQRAGR